MAGRNRMPRQPMNSDLHGYRDGPPPPLPRVARGHAMPPPPLPFEEEIALRRDEIRRIVADNRHLMDEIVALRRELPHVKDELHVLSQAMPKLRAEKEAETRELIQRGLKLEGELRSLEPFREELMQLRSEFKKLEALREEMSAKVQSMTKELKHLQMENQQMPILRTELDGLHQELMRTRTAHEYEMKASAEQMEQKQAMEKNLVSMAREIEKLRAELEKRGRGPVPGPYGMPKANPEMGFSGGFREGYGADKGFYGGGPWPPYDSRGFPHH
ncbi:protein FLX-like 3 isoform X2 [Ananas comosus]|uniref:Protein FLX-like 3 n=1 Tax=Ananas comosus TaxID=4615 RepID=A0A199UZ70_ANACO|nr:protein FLX-like 3 isoform X2 [Ananas comosus]OAY69935.1 Protein FLX-like 3 [Ananas comosus]OAY85448.1 Protein FLX-like 3 [Ananas comosus]